MLKRLTTLFVAFCAPTLTHVALHCFFVLPAFSQDVGNPKLLLSVRTLPEIKISLAQCAGQLSYAMARVSSGTLKTPDDQGAVAAWSRLAQLNLRFANRIQGGESGDKIAEDFYKRLSLRHNLIVKEHGVGANGTRLAFDLAQDGVTKCSDYTQNPRLSEQLRQAPQ